MPPPLKDCLPSPKDTQWKYIPSTGRADIYFDSYAQETETVEGYSLLGIDFEVK